MKKMYGVGAYSFILFFLDITAYHIIKLIGLQNFWGIIPILVYVVLRLGRKIIKKSVAKSVLDEISNMISLIIFYSVISNNKIYGFIWKRYSLLSFVACVLLFSLIIVGQFNLKRENNAESKEEKNLFNLFYLNTSKTHEIAMLIDNKIMKTIEKEQESEELIKSSISGIYGKKDIITNEIGYSSEESFKKRVYENFDVKMTKSIMLRKIYETVLNNKNKKLIEGDLVHFKNIELQQRNVDDTVMLLNILQDSKIKNQGNEDLEINLNKMMEKMLDDFTIDYTFKYVWNNEEGKEYIIQLPYKASNNFENGYQHNDLQLGKLSLIGIYRGEVNFSERDSISSKFLEMMEKSIASNSIKDKKDEIMQLSYTKEDVDTVAFNLKHNKLEGTLLLIDVIAIIQEININREEENNNVTCI